MKTGILLSDTLREHAITFEEIANNYKLSTQEIEIFETLKEKFLSQINYSNSNKDQINIFKSGTEQYIKKGLDQNYFLTLQELKEAKKTGIFGPKKLNIPPNFKNELLELNQLINEEFLSNLVHVWHSYLWTPSFVEFIETNYEAILQPLQSIFDNSDENIYINTGIYIVYPGEKGLRPLHKDYATLNTINLYLALSDIDQNSSPVVFFPGTYKDTEQPQEYINYLIKNDLINDLDLIVKANSIASAKMSNTKAEYINGICSTFLTFLARYKQGLMKYNKSNEVEGVFFKQKAGEYIIFPANIWHQSISINDSNQNTSLEPRVALTVRITRDIDYEKSLNSFQNLSEHHLEFIAKKFKLDVNNLKEILFNFYDKNKVRFSILLNSSNTDKSCITFKNLKNFYNNIKIKDSIEVQIKDIDICHISKVNGCKFFDINYQDTKRNFLILGYNRIKGDKIRLQSFIKNPKLSAITLLAWNDSTIITFSDSIKQIYVYNVQANDIDIILNDSSTTIAQEPISYSYIQ